MSFADFEGQDFAVRILSAHIQHSRLASTYLFTGRELSGREDLALAFASALLCEKSNCFRPCECRNCTRAVQQVHPDIRRLGSSGGKSIKIEEVRDLISWAFLKPYEAKWKVSILADADRLTPEASHALLKTLEEPPERTIFCLLVESRSQVLETIQSRSFEIRLRPVEEKTGQTLQHSEWLSWLREKNWEDPFEAWQNVSREELKGSLESLMMFFRQVVEKASKEDRPSPLSAMGTEAMDVIYDSKEALESNVNQKLVLSRLGMKLRNLSEQASSIPGGAWAFTEAVPVSPKKTDPKKAS